MALKTIGGMSQLYYHVIPGNLEMIVTSPTRDGIFKNLSQIHFNKFTEFIADILVKVEGHKLVDITDGQGDEKQDILTINPEGRRCLTQCKHTISYTDHYNGDDLDLMMAACLRKDCMEAIFVTNSDLTPQGKKYVTDGEYNRGISSEEDFRKISYWNGLKIWDRIKNNQDIINKWFGNLGQVHGLRNFKFDLTIQKMPFKAEDTNNAAEVFEDIFRLLKLMPWVKEVEENFLHQVNISDKYEITLKKGFQVTSELDINFMSPSTDLEFINKALSALTIEVKVKSDQPFSPGSLRDEIVKRIFNEVLKDKLENDEWWQILTSQAKSFIYLHDIGEPREIDLASAEAFVKTNNTSTISEIKYATELGQKFKVVASEDDYIFLHKTTLIQTTILFEQKINPVHQYNNQIVQYGQLDKIKDFDFFSIKGIDSSMMMRLRRLLHYEWFVFQMNEDTLIWAQDPNTEPAQIDTVNTKILAVGLTKQQVRKEDVPIILRNIRNDLAPATWMYTSEINSLTTPILLDRRIFMLSKDIRSKKLILQKQMKLLELKYNYEHEFGFVNLNEGIYSINSNELKGMLFDIFTFRGVRMLDIGFNNNKVSVWVRFKEGNLESSESLAQHYIGEYKKIYNQVKKIIMD